MEENRIYKLGFKPLHIHIEPTKACNARCPQCPRTFRNTTLEHPAIKQDELDSSLLSALLKDEYFSEVTDCYINGNHGDIVMHSNPRQLIESLIDNGIKNIRINTNGGALNSAFWSWLGTIEEVTVEFAIDGLEDTHHLYRRNTSFKTIIRNATTYISTGGTAVCAMNLFGNNEHQKDAVRDLCNELGFKDITYRDGQRFSQTSEICYDKDFNELYHLYPTKEFADKHNLSEPVKYDNGNTNPSPYNRAGSVENIKCKAAKRKQIYISADLRMWPCTWTENEHYHPKIHNQETMIVTEFGNDRYFNSLKHHTVSEVLNDCRLFERIESSWGKPNCMHACSRICS